MSLPQTEAINAASHGLDTCAPEDALRRLLHGQSQALDTVSQAIPQIAEAARLLADTLRNGGRLVTAAAGSSALMGMADAAELPGTFGIAADRILILPAGGFLQDAHMPGGSEDDAEDGRRAARQIAATDAVLALSASGRTAYTCALATEARARGARLIAIANAPDTPLLQGADVAICLPTPPELIAGSTRMGAGTTQKVALNMMSTLMAIHLGHVFDGNMVNLRADNTKLRERASRMVADIAGVSPETARTALDTADGEVKAAILLASGAGDLGAAQALLAQTDGHLRPALLRLDQHTTNGRET